MIDKILGFSIANPFVVMGLSLLLGIAGFVALQKLPIDAVPDITNNQVQINALRLGLSPLEMEKQVTLPIENALAGIPGLEMTRSLTRNGFMQVTAIFDDHVDIYFARAQIAERLGQIKEELPTSTDVKMGPISTGLSEVYMWTIELTPEAEKQFATEQEKGAYLREVQDWIIKPQLKKVPGLAGVDSIGGWVKEYRIEPKLERLEALKISLSDLRGAIEASSGAIGPGTIQKGAEAYLVRADGRLNSTEEVAEIIIAMQDGLPVLLKDVADLSIGGEERYGSSTENGREVVTGTAMMRIGANSREVAKAVDLQIQEIKKTLPAGITLKTVLNRTKLVDSTIHTVVKNLSEGALLVILVLFLFLNNFRAALIVSLVIPLSMLMTAIGMYKNGISGNLMSLGAIDFGLIVDGAVIITENALRRSCLFSACKEMIRPTLFGQAIIMVVYIPILLLSGVEGKMFHPMAWTVIFALISAFILSITFVPAALSLFVKSGHAEKNRFVKAAKRIYQPLLAHTLMAPSKVVLPSVLALVIAGLLFQHLGQEFIPQLDEKDIALQAMRIPSVSLAESTAMQKKVETTLKKLDEINFVFSKTGTAEMASDPMTPNLSDTFVMLHPREQWPDPTLTKEGLIEKMELALAELPGNNFEFTQPIELRFNELIGGTKSDLAVQIYGDDFATMGKVASKIAGIIEKVPGAKDIKVGQTDGLPLLNIAFDRPALARWGLPMKEGLEAVEIALGGGKAGVIYEGDRKFNLVVKLSDTARANLDILGLLPLKFPDTLNIPFVPLKEVAKIEFTEGLNEIKREQGKRFVAVEANVRGRDLGSFVEEVKDKIEGVTPQGYWLEFGGQFEHLVSSKERLLLVLPISFLLILLLLYTALGSLKDALLVFTAVPFASVGGIVALYLNGMPFSISAAVGFIALFGIAVLNGLVLLTSIHSRLTAQEPLEQAIEEGSLERLRPVLMTALVAMLGFLPMALSQSPGAEVQKPLAIVVIGGLFTSTLLTLAILPALFKLTYRRLS